jgi:hypothetical protein
VSVDISMDLAADFAIQAVIVQFGRMIFELSRIVSIFGAINSAIRPAINRFHSSSSSSWLIRDSSSDFSRLILDFGRNNSGFTAPTSISQLDHRFSQPEHAISTRFGLHTRFPGLICAL